MRRSARRPGSAAAGTLYSKIDCAARSPPPNVPPVTVRCAITTLTASGVNDFGQVGDDLADHRVVVPGHLGRGGRDELRGPDRVPLGQERQHGDVDPFAGRAGVEADHAALVGRPDRSDQGDAGGAHQRPVGVESGRTVVVPGDGDDLGAGVAQGQQGLHDQLLGVGGRRGGRRTGRRR